MEKIKEEKSDFNTRSWIGRRRGGDRPETQRPVRKPLPTGKDEYSYGVLVVGSIITTQRP